MAKNVNLTRVRGYYTIMVICVLKIFIHTNIKMTRKILSDESKNPCEIKGSSGNYSHLVYPFAPWSDLGWIVRGSLSHTDVVNHCCDLVLVHAHSFLVETDLPPVVPQFQQRDQEWQLPFLSSRGLVRTVVFEG